MARLESLNTAPSCSRQHPSCFKKYCCHSPQECVRPAHCLLRTNRLIVTSSHSFCLRGRLVLFTAATVGKAGLCRGGRWMMEFAGHRTRSRVIEFCVGDSRSFQGHLSTQPQPAEVGSLCCCFPAQGDVVWHPGWFPAFVSGQLSRGGKG